MALAAPRIATALACWLSGRATEAWRIADDVLQLHDRARGPTGAGRGGRDGGHHGAARRRAGGREQAGRRGAARRATRSVPGSGGSGPRSLQWWAGEGIEEPELPGPLLRPYFEMLRADDALVSAERARPSGPTPSRRSDAPVSVLRGGDPPGAGRRACGVRPVEAAAGTTGRRSRWPVGKGPRCWSCGRSPTWARHALGAPDRVRDELAALRRRSSPRAGRAGASNEARQTLESP